ncbi:MAG: hypothetical protein V3T83_14465 [Acidobacteriota bacterium]
MKIFQESAGAVFRRLKAGIAILFLFALAGLLLKPLAGVSYQAGNFWASDVLPFIILGIFYAYGIAQRGGRLAQVVGNALMLGYSAALFRIAFTVIDINFQVGGYYTDAALANVGTVQFAITYALYPLIPWAAGNLGYLLGSGKLGHYLRRSRTGLALLGIVALARFATQPLLGLDPAQGASLLSVTWALLLAAVIYAAVIARKGGSFTDLLGTCLALAGIHVLVALLILIDDGLGLQTWYTTPPASGNAPATLGHMIGHLFAVPIFGSVLWGPASLIYLIAGGRRLRRTFSAGGRGLIPGCP